MTTPTLRMTFAISFFAILLCLGGGAATWAQNAELPTHSREEIQAVIDTLEDPTAREQLIRQLQILAETQQKKPQEHAEVQTAAAQLLQVIAKRVEMVTATVLEVTGIINDIPQGLDWLKRQVGEEENRAFWIDIFVNIAIIVALGYVAFFVSRRILQRPRRALREKEGLPAWSRLLRLGARMAFDLLPVAIFAIGVYLTLGLVNPLAKARLVVLTWINAFIVNQLVVIVARALFAATAPKLRLNRLTDETAHYLEIWTKRLAGLVIYGYATLQVALLLGAPASFYEVLLRLLGLVVAAMLIVLILQNRKEVGASLRNLAQRDSNGGRPFLRHALEQAGRIWHILAILYVLLFYGVWALNIPGGALYLLKSTLLTALAVGIGATLLRALRSAFSRGFKIGEELKGRFPGLEERTNRYLTLVQKTLRWVIIAVVVLAVFQAWGADSFQWLASESGRVLVGALLTIGGILLMSFIVWEAANAYIESYLSAKTEDGVTQLYSARTRTLMAVIRKALMIVLVVFTTLMILSELGVNIGPLLAGAGVLGLAIGFGSQKLVQDVITGVFILLEDQMAVGDVVDVGGKAGVVEAVSIRTLRLRDLKGTVHTIPFSAIASVSNLTKEFSFYLLEVGIAYREDVDEVMAVLKEIGADLQQDEEYGAQILEPLEVLGVDSFADSAVVIKARIKTRPVKQWWVGREFNRRMKKRFDELDIEIPFPHQTLYFGVDKSQSAPPANVRIVSPAAEQAMEKAGQPRPEEEEEEQKPESQPAPRQE